MTVRTTFLRAGAAGLTVLAAAAASVGASASFDAERHGTHAGDERGHGHGKGHGHGHGYGKDRARNVIFIQGDGMGLSTRELIRIATEGKDGQLAMDTLEYAGWTATDSVDPDDAVTDSAAGATAFSTGVRTFNGGVGVDADGNPVTTLLERAKRSGKATGLVSTAQVTDASPAAFGAHVVDRYDQSEIARQYLEDSRPDVLLGGGEDFWYPAGDPGAWPDNPAEDPTEESKGTEGNLVERAQELGYTHVSDAEGLAAADGDRLLGLFANEEMFQQANEGEGDVYSPEVPLVDMAAAALEVVSQDRDGFFLFLEEEAIDEFAHRSNATRTIEAGQALEATVALALDFQKKHRDTLVLVVGDHATGGVAIENVDDEDESGAGATAEDGPFPVPGTDLEFTVDWTTGGHTGEATPITAQGPGARGLGGAQLNTDVHDAVLRAMFPRGRR
ncbi:alkaline phosphatase [Isoptericola sp. NEAU-Y5]|uniref:Alkaline phosphatase n=1 Tax=Isoptericola luteus TaxID=2879484 RepID=A0ABS7ZC69_9MICO|nr:alkaline phosphatase [Isoptericola sp. NEAU-Y5]MCA5892498.1 alkaline phosphatase [Isoptericola sp. NEAU-Y5]